MNVEKVQFSEPLFFLKIIGMHPSEKGRISFVCRTISVLSYGIPISLGLLELAFNSQGIETYARASDTLIPQCQLLAKLIVLLTYHKGIFELLNCSKKFWNFNEFGSKYIEDFVRIHVFLRRFFNLYKIIISFTCAQFLVVKVVTKSKVPIAISLGENKGLESPYDELYMVLHTFTTFVTINLVIGFDGLFFYFIGHVLSEMKMVKVAFGNCKIEKNWDEEKRFRTAAIHHSRVLDFVTKFNRVCSVMLLVQHMSCLFGICFGLYLMIKDGIPPNVDSASKYIPYIITFILQTWTFCLAGDLVIHWSLEMTNEIFYSDWSKNYSYKNSLGKIIAMQRGQKSVKLTLGGFGNLDLKSFKLVLKNAFSFFTFMNAVLEKKLD